MGCGYRGLGFVPVSSVVLVINWLFINRIGLVSFINRTEYPLCVGVSRIGKFKNLELMLNVKYGVWWWQKVLSSFLTWAHAKFIFYWQFVVGLCCNGFDLFRMLDCLNFLHFKLAFCLFFLVVSESRNVDPSLQPKYLCLTSHLGLLCKSWGVRFSFLVDPQ